MKLLKEIDLLNKRVLVRTDLNVPIINNKITNDARILATIPTIEHILERKGQVILLSHLGRPKEGNYDQAFSLKIVADKLSEILSKKVSFISNYLDGFNDDSPLILLENVRFLKGEKSNDEALSAKLANICDVFVMDAFATAHRAHSSTCGIIKFAKESCAGLLLERELDALNKILLKPEHPILAIVGGAKVSTKLPLIKSLASKVDKLIIGGGIANTFIHAKGYNIGNSLYEADLLDTAKNIMKKVDIPIPIDVIVGKTFSENATATIKELPEIEIDDIILDIGPKTQKLYDEIIKSSNTVLLNGPVGVFEFDQFSSGTQSVLHSIIENNGFCVAGGGDTISAIEKFGCSEKIDYISTAGGAFLEYLEGKELPSIYELNKSF